MGRRFLSHLLITLAVLSLSLTFFVWLIDSVVLNPSKLVGSLRESEVPTAIANIIPERISESNKEVAQQTEDISSKVAVVVTPDYVDQKIEAIAVSVIGFVKGEKADPVIDLADFPERLRASGIEAGDDINKTFAEPINLNKEGSLSKLPEAYDKFVLVKRLGIIIFVVLLAAEWFAAPKGEKLKRVGRIFLHAAIWFGTFALVLAVALPNLLLPEVRTATNDPAMNALIESLVKSIQSLFTQYFIGSAIVCGVLTVVFYVLRKVINGGNNSSSTPSATKPAPTKS